MTISPKQDRNTQVIFYRTAEWVCRGLQNTDAESCRNAGQYCRSGKKPIWRPYLSTRHSWLGGNEIVTIRAEINRNRSSGSEIVKKVSFNRDYLSLL